jgi:hypothetical protein
MNMKYKHLLLVGVLLLVSLYIYKDYNSYKDNLNKDTRTKVEYIFGTMNEDEVLNKGKNIFLDTIKVISYDYFETEKDNSDNYNIYNINNENGYLRVLNYSKVNELFNTVDIDKYNTLVGYINYENKDYIKVFSKELNNNYVGSIITLEDYDNDIVTYKSINYYCNNYKFIGILDNIPECDITNTSENIFTLRKYNNTLKVNDIEEFLGNKKIY